jgi:hypothetical protein
MKVVLMFRAVGDILSDVLQKTSCNCGQNATPQDAPSAASGCHRQQQQQSERLCLSTQTHLQHICVEEVVA